MDTIQRFKTNLDEVDRLIHFDRELLQIVRGSVHTLHEELKKKNGDPRFNGKRVLDVLDGLSQNETIQKKYQTIYNQALVLLVSHFASALGDLFREAVAAKLSSDDSSDLYKEEFKLTVEELKDRDWSLRDAIPDLLIAKYDFTFQDMGATYRAFKNFTSLTPPRGTEMNNIIAAQACRHCIVHVGGKVGEKSVKQVSKAFPRTFQTELRVGDQLAITQIELELIKNDMLRFIQGFKSESMG
jgi:hypothetical protein